MTKAICPGSFDPVTYGHLDIIRRASKTFDSVVVTIMVNVRKQPLFTLSERVTMLSEALSDLPNVTVMPGEGLLVDFARAQGAEVIVKGLRPIQDFEYEWQMGMVNQALSDAVETCFFMSRKEYSYLSSSIVRELAAHGGNLDQFVPASVAQRLREKFAQSE